jgi:hypothetical protein
MRDELQVPEGAGTLPFLQEIVRIAELLRVTLPTVRLVTPSARDRWPLVTPLGNARNSDDWLVLDATAPRHPRPAAARLPAGPGPRPHPVRPRQPVHGPLRLPPRTPGPRRPPPRSCARFSRIAAFSADRAGLLAAGEFAPAARARPRRAASSSRPGTRPSPSSANASAPSRSSTTAASSPASARAADSCRINPSVTVLVEQLMHRQTPDALPEANTAATADTAAPASAPEFTAGYAVPADAWPLARCDQRLTQRLGIL